MKKFALLLLLFFATLTSTAQILDPVKWTSKIEKKSDSEYLLTFNGTIEADWHMYSQFTPEGGVNPLEVLANNSENNFSLEGKAKESKTRTAFNDVFKIDETFFENTVELQQTVKISNADNALLQIELSYQVCKEVCIQQNKYFEFNTKELSASEVKVFTEIKDEAKKEPVSVVKAEKKDEKDENTNPWTILVGTFLAGILVTFTPCVFPMIPMTISFFLKQNSNKARGKFNAFFYGFCIIGIYVLISVPFHLFESLNPDIFSEISTNVYLNVFFFLIFVVFAISFFGAFEITMPNSIANKADSASNTSGLVGIFFMALTLIIVSFSCTGPALGLVLGSVLSTEGGATLLTISMLGFGLGLAMPFIFFALFPSMLKSLPKSGGWLNSVKVVFGFIELALAFKFLSNADLVLQLHLLEREVFLAIWIAIFFALFLYLFGKLTLPHDSPMQSVSVGRMLLGLITLAFTIYLVPGLWGAPLKIISGFPPPMNYSESPLGMANNSGSVSNQELPDGAKLSVHGLIAFEDYADGLAYAQKENKPILLDFTGRACVNCRKMEEFVWSDPAVLALLKNDVVLISLYCDQKTKLPENEHFKSSITGNKITTIGGKWSDFQIAKYNSNARPYYVIIDNEEKMLGEAIAYEPDIETYLNWLKSGISQFKK